MSQINKLVLYALLKITFPVAQYFMKRSVSYACMLKTREIQVEIDRKL